MPLEVGDTFVVALDGGGFGVVRAVRFDRYDEATVIVPSHRVFESAPTIAGIDPAKGLYACNIATNVRPELALSVTKVKVGPPRTFKKLGNVPPHRQETVAFAYRVGKWIDVLRQWAGDRKTLWERTANRPALKPSPTWRDDLVALRDRPPMLHLSRPRTKDIAVALAAMFEALLARRSAGGKTVIVAAIRCINAIHDKHRCIETIQRESLCDHLDRVAAAVGARLDWGAVRTW